MAHLPHITHATAVRIGDRLDALKPLLVVAGVAALVIAVAVAGAVSGAATFLSILDLIGSHR
jgi:hypothetical protein